MSKVIGKPLAVEPSSPPSGAVDRSTRTLTNSASVNPLFMRGSVGPKASDSTGWTRTNRPCTPRTTTRTEATIEDLVLTVRKEWDTAATWDSMGPRRSPRPSRPARSSCSPRCGPSTTSSNDGRPGRPETHPSPPSATGLASARGRLEAAGTGQLRCGRRAGDQGRTPDRGAQRHLPTRWVARLVADGGERDGQGRGRVADRALAGGRPARLRAVRQRHDLPGPHTHPDVVGRVSGLCLSLGVVPVFVVPHEFGFQSMIENYNGTWQEEAGPASSTARCRTCRGDRGDRDRVRRHRTDRIESAPRRRAFPKRWRLDLQSRPRGRIIYVRRTSAVGAVDVGRSSRWTRTG